MYIIKLTNDTNIEKNILTISGKSMNFYDLKKSKVSRQNSFIFNQVNKLTI